MVANEVYGDGDGDSYSIPEKAEQKYPNLGSTLNQLVARVEARESSAEEAAKEAPVHQGSADGGNHLSVGSCGRGGDFPGG